MVILNRNFVNVKKKLLKLSRKDKNNKVLRVFEKLSNEVFTFNIHLKTSKLSSWKST